MQALRVAALVACLSLAAAVESESPACVIELECRECVPDHMPLVTSHAARGGRVLAARGDALQLSCGAGTLLAYPSRASLQVVCERDGRYRVPLDNSLRHLLELGCQADVFEDVLHEVQQCGAPLQGRAYQAAGAGGARHVAALCYDADRAITRRAHAVTTPQTGLSLAPHSDDFAPLSILGNFNHMFDATTRSEGEALFADDASATRRLRELLKHARVTLADHGVTAAKLLAPHYFDDQDARVTDFASNKVVAWRSVAHGNWRHLQRDVSLALRSARRGNVTLHVVAGGRGEAAVRGAGGRVGVSLRAGGRFPAPRYLWTALLHPGRRAGIALVVLNDPFVAVSEIKEAVFCESMCSSISWLRELRRNRNYETPALGLAFCCGLRDFTGLVRDLPAALLPGLPLYSTLTDLHDLDLHDSDTITGV